MYHNLDAAYSVILADGSVWMVVRYEAMANSIAARCNEDAALVNSGKTPAHVVQGDARVP